MRAVPLVLAALIAIGVTACSEGSESSLPRPSKTFCEAAYQYDVRVEKRASISEQIKLVREMDDHAPKDISRDTATFLDALERRAGGDMSVVDNPKIQDAVENVNRRAANGCKLYQTDEPGGGGI
jgi:hypothetical protein